jgi:phosphoserine phosphatase
MSHVATLISSPAKPAVTDAALAAAAKALPSAGQPLWLANGIAADLPFDGGKADLRALQEDLRKQFASSKIDVVLQPTEGRRKRLYLSDMDSTVIGQECIDELADFVAMKPRVAEITERAMRGEIDFEPALRERVNFLKNLPVTVINEVIEKRITLTPGATALVATMRHHGAHTCLVSGGFTQFTEKIAAMIGFDEQRGNTLSVEDGKISGIEEPILGREAKLETLKELLTRLKLKPEETLVSGDGANDMPMLEAAGMGVAYRARPIVAEMAHARIDFGDLTALLYLQGYKREDFIEPA